MKKLCVFYTNCQSLGIRHFLLKTPLADEFDFSLQNNWQLILGELPRAGFFDALRRADVLIYQPTGEFLCTDGFTMPACEKLIGEYVRPDCKLISFSYQYNSGFFPILKVAPGIDGYITSRSVKDCATRDTPRSMESSFDANAFHFDCALRFAECLAEQSRREQDTDIQMVPFILAHFQKQRLFLTQNHPTSLLYRELAAQVAGLMNFDLAWADIPITSDNEAGMNGTLPIHPAVVAELGLQYPADADFSYYRTLLADLAAGKE